MIYINEIEKVLNTDKKKAKVLKPPLKDKPERIKKQLLACMKDLEKEHEEINTKMADPDKEVQDEAKVRMYSCPDRGPFALQMDVFQL